MNRMMSVQALLLTVSISMGCSLEHHSVGILAATQTGAAPNDALIVETDDRATLVVAASMDSAVQFFDIAESKANTLTLSSANIFFKPNAQGVSPNPWSLAATSDGRFLIVTLFDDHSVALVDLKTRTLLSIVEPLTKGQRHPLFALPEPVTLRKSKDVLGDQTSLTNVSKMRALHPTAVKIVGNQVLVAFTNLLEWAEFPDAPSVYGPAVLARYVLDDNKLSWAESLALPCTNPSDLVVHDNQTQVVVACSGRMAFDGNHEMQLRDGSALVFLELLRPDALSSPRLKLSGTIELHRFSPAKMITHKEALFVTNSLKRQLLFVPKAAKTEDETQVIALNPDLPEEPGYLSSIIKWNDDIAFVSDFRNDQLVALHLDGKRLHPSPFSKPILLSGHEKPLAFKGPGSISKRQRTVPSAGSPDLYVVMALSSEVIGVDLAAVVE